ncbi:MAG: transposase [Candidatus Omnitrophica bacterium]|nr:transposase [Candidatus Omnitrophota bacterium]MBU3934285.1 transposase [Candidatus Omnitrophota bacterium]
MALTITHAKRERFNYKDVIYHITTRCNNRENLIKNEVDFKKYRFIVRKSKEKCGFLLYDYIIMSNHVHLIIQPRSTLDISKIMHSINRRYARWYNERYKRKGHFWEGRFYGELIKDELQLLAVMRYIDLNPVRANLCQNPAEWKYSGARLYLNGEKDSLIDIAQTYLELGQTDKTRQEAYSHIFPFNLTNLTRLESDSCASMATVI